MWLRLISLMVLLLFIAAPAGSAQQPAPGQNITPSGMPPVAGQNDASARKPAAISRIFRIRPGARFRDCADCPDMVVIPRGKFMMGTPMNELGRSSDEGPMHEVTFERPFAIGLYEITFDEWDACVAAHGCDHIPPDGNWGRGRRPVINVSWRDAREYVRWLSKITGENYRLPSEAEWEYAARAGTISPRFWEEREIACAFANVYDASAQRVHRFEWDNFSCIDAQQSTAPVGAFLPNKFGLYDMLGNVWEWTADCWIPDYNNAPASGKARGRGFAGADCRRHVTRGGSWQNVAWATRSGYRNWQGSGTRSRQIGFRVARFSR